MKPALQIRVQRYGWDKASRYYDDSWKEQLKPAQDRLLDMAALKQGEDVIETACGSGLVTFRAAMAVAPDGQVVATDLSEEMIRRAASLAEEKQISNVIFKRMNAEQIELNGRHFDAALCGLGLMYVPDPVKALSEKNRLLKPDGRAVVAIWGERRRCGWAEIFPIVDRRVSSDVCPLFFQQGTGNTIVHTFSQAGFKDIEVDRFHVTLSYPNQELALTAAFSGGPVALAYEKFDEETRAGVHAEYLDSIAEFRVGDGYEIPGEFVVASGRK
ncbi:MAG: methyltransferase domain-containing protein [Balneolaceae bacterium]|nr:MAG: methyltransferase domain-containing protein [Balneolaceae bacterium]